MEGNSISIKPVFWRIIVWRFIPAYIGGLTALLITNRVTDLWLMIALAVLVGTFIGHLLMPNKFDIVISEGKINGPGDGFFYSRESFPITEWHTSSMNNQTLYERISGFHTLHSITGKKITVVNFIYGKPAIQKLYKLLEQ